MDVGSKLRAALIGAAAAAALLTILSAPAHAQRVRYRGLYTYGHEVNAFCPQINSQCYWLSSESPEDVREALEGLDATSEAGPYQPVCVVIEAEIDRDSERTGFAAEYDGLITVTHLFGRCEFTDLVTHGDLQHHRWLLEEINGARPDPIVLSRESRPELDFGASMHVFGKSGCNEFAGRARLIGAGLRIEVLESSQVSCSSVVQDIDATIMHVLDGATSVRVTADRRLTLARDEVSLAYVLRDWVD